MTTGANSRAVRFDLRTKIIVLAAVNILLFLSSSAAFEWVLMGSSLLVVAVGGQPKSAMHFLAAFLLMLLAGHLLVPRVHGFAGTLVLFMAVAVRKILPCLMLGKWILTGTQVSEFVATMWKLHMPRDIIIPVSVVFRYFPTLREEWQSLRMAMKMRGIGLSMEHVFVPLLVSAVNISEELSAAALCRGLDSPGSHTCLEDIRFTRLDYVAIAWWLLLTVAAVGLKAGGLL
ncbi:energy-coupling factor transporter transmembrane protein EcfT [Clostridia bacterium OttesenSCG-928-O13]|nr:energy-coupling factor transporter transmembrane protein EcfT [Clostridia bacterium OttesenSCG-928-O13]